MYRSPSLTKHSYTKSMGDLMSSATGAFFLVSISPQPRGNPTYRVNVWREITGIRAPIVRIVNARHMRHQTHARPLIGQIIQRILQIRCGDQPHQNVVSDDGQPPIELARLVEELKLRAQARGRDDGRAGNVDDSLLARAGHNVGQVRGEDGLVLVVEEGVGVHLGKEVLRGLVW